MLSRDDACIIAQCTPSGPGALALLRISGSDARTIGTQLARLASGKSVDAVTSHTIHYGSIINEHGDTIDQVMIIVMDGPRTFTGQDTIEITCHNNPFLIQAIIDRALALGARLAQEGEFTRRSFLSGKLDLIQAESINELIAAQTQHALKKSLTHLEGSFSHWIETLQTDLLKTIAWCEASFEFLDEEVSFAEQIREHLTMMLTKITTIKKSFAVEQQIRNGIKIALIGSVNAGKSSLFNLLLAQKRAIVTNQAGTTRDSIEASITYQGAAWTLIDTAGLRNTDNVIEQEGIKRSYDEAQKADVIVLVIDGSRALSDQERDIYLDIKRTHQTKCILVQNKIDCPVDVHNDLVKECTVALSAQTGHNKEVLEEAIDAKIATLLQGLDAPFLLNKRQHGLLTSLEHALDHILTECTQEPQYEILSYKLQDALTTLSELTGKSISEAGLDTVFREFCVGK